MACAGVCGGSVFKRADFAGERRGIVRVGANLDQFLSAVAMAREEIDLESAGRLDVGDLRPAALSFDEDDGFQRMAGVGFAAGHLMTLDYVAQQQHVHVALQQVAALHWTEALGFRETSGDEIIGKMMVASATSIRLPHPITNSSMELSIVSFRRM